MLEINNATLKASINPFGAELSSLTHLGKEFIWHGDDNYWGGRAPILFPIVGALKDGSMRYQGKRYEMPRHGIARRCTFKCIHHSTTGVTFSLKANEQTRELYPWDFELQAHFNLTESDIAVRYEVYNEDSSTMLFSIGSHPAFALQIDDSYSFNDYAIGFNQPEDFAIYALTEQGLLETTPQPLATSNNTIILTEDIFKNDALVLRNIKSDKISLYRGTDVLLTVDTGGAPHLGIWSKPAAPFVCIEPWLGTSDFVDASGEFDAKPDLISLMPQKSFQHSYKINLPKSFC